MNAYIAGICGAPCTGKTTLAEWLHAELSANGRACTLLTEPARELAARGVRIDAAMRRADYDAFLAAYLERDAGAGSGVLAIADRTPLDHFCYLAVNRELGRHRSLSAAFVERHRRAALEALAPYRLLLYLPNALGLADDSFRTADPEYQAALDAVLLKLLAEVQLPLVHLPVALPERRQAALNAIAECWPEQASETIGLQCF